MKIIVIWHIVAFLLLTTMAGVLHGQEIMEHTRMIAGGYGEINELDANPRLQEVATYAVEQITQNDNIQLNKNYSFASYLTTSENGEKNYSVKVVHAYQQVVAGMNYKMIIAIHDLKNNKCIGSFKVTVYDHFGDLSVSNWGGEISCT